MAERTRKEIQFNEDYLNRTGLLLFQYLYLLKTNIFTTNQGYVGQTLKTLITLINLSNIKYNGYIVMEYNYSNYVYYLISLKEIIGQYQPTFRGLHQ